MPEILTLNSQAPDMIAKVRSDLSLHTCIAIFKSLIQSKWEYALHLCPISEIIIGNIRGSQIVSTN